MAWLSDFWQSLQSNLQFRLYCGRKRVQHSFDIELSASEAKQLEEWLWLRERLKQIPRWFQGHEQFVEYSLYLKETEYAYGSAHALVALAVSKEKKVRAHCALAKVLLSKSAFDRALQELDLISITLEVKLLKAAALMGKGQHGEAREILESIPPEKRPNDAEMALRYTKGDWKTSGT